MGKSQLCYRVLEACIATKNPCVTGITIELGMTVPWSLCRGSDERTTRMNAHNNCYPFEGRSRLMVRSSNPLDNTEGTET